MIRPATLLDIPTLLQLGEIMHAESRYRVLRFSATKLESTLRNVLATPDGFLWVATHGERIVGGLAAVCTPHWASEDLVSTDLALFMVPEKRGGMHAALLVNKYKQWALERGAVMRDIGVTTGVRPEETVRLFELLGARRIGFVLEL